MTTRLLRPVSYTSPTSSASDNCRASAHPPLDLDKSHLLDADHDATRIADALRHSPHIADAVGEPGDATVRFTSVSGMGFTLTLQDAEPTRDDILPEPVITEAVAGALLNHQLRVRYA